MASSKETYCLCGQPYNIGQFMIECDCCREWFHGSCVDVKIYQSDDIDKYHCPKCIQTYGPSVLKIPTNHHRADRYEIGAESRPPQAGAPAWVRALAARPLRPSAQALTRMLPHQFNEEFVKNNGFVRPVVFNTPDGLDLKMPNAATFTVRTVLRFCGAQFELEVIDVRKQATLRMSLGEFIDYFETPPEQREDKVLNVLSLEFSDTTMSALVEPPGLARRLDWAPRVWPVSKEGPPRPSVQKYCLMSAGGSYTDFHVDFGGTTVWYHVLHGRKIFYLIPPTSTNLALYQQWSASAHQNEQFFGDLVEWYGTTELLPGETLFIPAGWIHAVLSPDDCLVFGGNFLHEYSIEMQLQIYEIERRVETPVLLRYPLFETMNWYAGSFLLTLLRRHNEDTQDEDYTMYENDHHFPPPDLPPLLIRGIRILTNALKEWHSLKTTDQQKRDNIPKCINSSQIVKELSKELRTLEKRLTTSKDRDIKPARNHHTPKSHTKKHSSHNSHKKSLKLTLPKPIMHIPHNGEHIDADKIEFKQEVYNKTYNVDNEGNYVENINNIQNVKYSAMDGLDEKMQFQTFEEQYQNDGSNSYVERLEKKNGGSVLRIKLNNSPAPTREDPPPYNLPEHSILKSHLIGQQIKPLHQWTISKKDQIPGDYQEEQILFTNDNLVQQNIIENQEISYGPGMYSTEDIQNYHYSETAKPGSYQPEYGYQNQNLQQDINITYQVDPNGYVNNGRIPTELEARYDNKFSIPQQIVETQDYTIQNAHLNGYHQPPPEYQQTYTTDYIIEEQKPSVSVPTPVRRSERPVRKRVSPTYDYEDGDLFIDETPAPTRRKPKHKAQYKHAAANNSYKSQQRVVPANGIESLIQASVLAEVEPQDNTEDAAVAMLSISERYNAAQTPSTVQPKSSMTFGLAVSTSPQEKRQRKPVMTHLDDDDDDDEEDIIKEVHRDEEYVYPSLEMSSDDDEEYTDRRRRNSRNRNDPKSEKDSSWSPRARLGRLVPRARGPARTAVRRECVRAALTHAARAPHPHPHPHPPPHAHRPHEPQPNAKRAVIAAKSKRPPPAPAPPSPNSKNSKQKKGMKTAKQRLGKILKIHKMMY